MFWVDEIVEDIIKKINKDSYLVTDWKTPSGHIHIGALRGVVIHNVVTQALKEKGKETLFQYGFDDFDPLDKMPVYIDKSWKKYMGMPMCNIPAPDGKSKNYADQYLTEFKKVFNQMKIEPKIALSSEAYKSGLFNEAIKIALDHPQEIRKIYKEISGSDKGVEWYPFHPICPKCGKIGVTKVTDWDGKVVTFTCEEKLVEWAQGCGYSGKISPFDGNGKFPWKVEWPAKWYSFGSDVEGEGKDHFAAGGSRDIADKIYKEIFKRKPPYDIRYEHFLIGGAKMSTSKGLGATAKDAADILPPNILKFLFIRTKYKKAIDFNPAGDSIPLLYDEYDRMAELSEKDPKAELARSYFFTELGFEGEKPKYLLRFSKIAYMLQMPRSNVFKYAEKEKGAALSEIEKQEIENRIEIAKKWLEIYAPENYKFTIAKNLPPSAKNLAAGQKEFLAKIAEAIESKDSWAGEDLHKEIHNIKQELNIDPRQAFAAIYQIFIGKDSGPQAGWLLASLDRKFVLNRLEEVTHA